MGSLSWAAGSGLACWGPGRAQTEPFVLFLRLPPDEGREKGLSCSAGRLAEQGLPGTVDWGCWRHKGPVDGGWGKAAFQKGLMAPECALSAPGVKATVS